MQLVKKKALFSASTPKILCYHIRKKWGEERREQVMMRTTVSEPARQALPGRRKRVVRVARIAVERTNICPYTLEDRNSCPSKKTVKKVCEYTLESCCS